VLLRGRRSLPTLLERMSEDIEQLRHTLAGRLVGIAVVGSLYGLDAAQAGLMLSGYILEEDVSWLCGGPRTGFDKPRRT